MSAVRYLLDEHIDPALRVQLVRHEPEMIVWIIGDPGAPVRGTPDPDILLWCEANGFLLVTENRASMPVHLKAHLEAGGHVPGILTLKPGTAMGDIIEELRLIWAASTSQEFRDLIVYLPIT
jgi:hypothetical protein